jgi:hypothetical protein
MTPVAPPVTLVASLYALGVLIGLWRTQARWPGRVALALLWPIGPLAFVLTVALLMLVSLVAFPLFGAVVVAAGAAAAILMRS